MEAVIGLAKVLELAVVAEGVETRPQLELLKEMGCRMGQGFLFSEPLSPQDMESFLITTSAAHGRLAAATGVDGMVGGQYLDVKELAPAGPDGLRRLHALKTGRLIAASVQCVLELFPAGEPETIMFGRFASELGVLFQIVDDILDVTGTDAALGKPSGSDARHGKRTYVSEHGLERARELATASHEAAQAALHGAAPAGAPELEQITDFIYTRTS